MNENHENSEQITPYIDKIKDIPLLSFEEERAFSIIIQERLAIIGAISDEEAKLDAEKNDLILDKAIKDLTTPNLRLVIKEAIDLYRKAKVSLKDLIGYGNYGLIKAAYKYDAEKFKTKFSTYATYWIRQEMYGFINNSHVVSIPFNILDLRQKYNKMMDVNKDLSDSELIEELDITQKNLQRAKDSNVTSVSLSQVIMNEGDSNIVTIGDLIVDEKDIPSDALEKKDKYAIMMEAIQELDPMSREIVCSQLLDSDKSNLTELGLKYNLSAERIRQLKEKALLALRRAIKRKSKLGIDNHGKEKL